jgi:hypothetical protein
MNRVNRWLHLPAVLLLSITLGLHWTALQWVAWGTMLVERTHTGSLAEAVDTTYDGQHPCKLCQLVETGRCADEGNTPLIKLPKLDLASTRISETAVYRPNLPGSDWADPAPGVFRTSPPPVPPPRGG